MNLNAILIYSSYGNARNYISYTRKQHTNDRDQEVYHTNEIHHNIKFINSPIPTKTDEHICMFLSLSN